jgi:hypothetical protein
MAEKLAARKRLPPPNVAHADDRLAVSAADRLVSLGATRVDWDRFPDDPDFIALADTGGNRFCIVDLGHDTARPARPVRPNLVKDWAPAR